MLKSQIRLITVTGAILFWLLPACWLPADSWVWPGVVTNRSGNGIYELVVTPSGIPPADQLLPVPSATLRCKQDGTWTNLWQRKLINNVAPVSAMVTDSGRYVVTFDEWHSVGKKPVVIYGEAGLLIAELSLADLKLAHTWVRAITHES